MSVYQWDALAFKHEGRCRICNRWTRGGVRKSGGMRFRHICEDCAKDRFAAGDIVMWTPAKTDPPIPHPAGECSMSARKEPPMPNDPHSHIQRARELTADAHLTRLGLNQGAEELIPRVICPCCASPVKVEQLPEGPTRITCGPCDWSIHIPSSIKDPVRWYRYHGRCIHHPVP